jgi:hypothetical protein
MYGEEGSFNLVVALVVIDAVLTYGAEENALARELLSHLCFGISEVTLELYPFTAVNFLRCLVQRYLDRRVLNATDTFLGLGKGLCGAIQHIGDGIRQLSRPERGE